MDHVIRLAGPDDLRVVEAIVREAYSPYVSRIGREPGPMRDDYARLIEAGQVRVIERRGAVLGILVLVAQTDAMLLDNVAVAAAAQGLGLGGALLAFAERSAIEAGFDRIRLYTNEAMTENLERYRRIGYVETHRVEEQGLRRVYMSKRLT